MPSRKTTIAILVLLFAGGLAATGAILYRADRSASAREAHPDDEEALVQKHPVVEGAFLFTDAVHENEWTTPLEDPEWIRASDQDFMRDDDFVIALVRSDDAYAIPWWVLKNHHVANLEFSDGPISITFCENCSSAVAYVGELDGEKLELRLVGLYNGSILVADKETGTLWASFSGEGLYGVHEGRQLSRVPVFLATWGEWSRRYPNTRVAWKEGESREGHGETSAPGRGAVGSRMERTLKRAVDGRIRPNSMVAGIAVESDELAVPLAAFDEAGPLIRMAVGDVGVTMYNEPDSYLVAAFADTLNGASVELRVDESGRLRDAATNSVWNLQGVAVEGPLRGSALTAIPVNVEEWYIWAAYHPETGVYGDPESADPS